MSDGLFVVTGTSSGIGEAVARQLLARGETVLLVARREEKLQVIQNEFPLARVCAADLSEASSLEVVTRAAHELGPVRGFVHCAGFDAPMPLSLVDDATAHKLYAVHAVFPMRFLGWMGRTANHTNPASAVLVSSVACHEGYPGGAAYAAAKGAVEGLFVSARTELAARNIHVNLITPGIVDTDMPKNGWMKLVPPERLAEIRAHYPNGFPKPETVATEILKLL